MTHPAEKTVSAAIRGLRREPPRGDAGNDVPLAQGIYFSWEPDAGVTIGLTSDDVTLLRARGHVATTPGWLTLNVTLGESVFAPGSVIALLAEVSGHPSMDLRAMIRSRREDASGDTLIPGGLTIGQRRGVRVLLHRVAQTEALAGPAGFHTLILSLPPTDFDLRLHDLRLSVLPPSRGLEVQAPTLSGYAV